jgi:hypothetical protein
MEDKTLEQVNHFKYLGYDVTFLEETDKEAKIKKIKKIYVALLGGHLKGKLGRIHK